MRYRALTIFLLLAGLGSLTAIPSIQSGDKRSPEPQGAAPRPMIEFHGDLLSVSVRNTPWEAVLKEIERQTGISIEVSGVLSGTLTQEFQSLPLEKGLRRLFRDANVLFFYTKETKENVAPEVLVRVQLFPKQGAVQGERQVTHSPSETLVLKEQAKPQDIAKAPEEVRQENEAESEDQVSAEEESAEERLKALDILSQENNMAALQKALLDADEAIRRRALELLAERNKHGASGVLVGLTKSDEPKMRLQALSLLQGEQPSGR